ncbi:hypothetical protein Hanom_Chr08g00736291 [Helianthus anomalus]
MTASLRQKDEERMKKNVDDLVEELKKVAKEEEVEEEADEKLKRSVEVADAGEAVAEEQQEEEADKKQTTEKAKMPTTGINISTESFEILNKNVDQCKKYMETCSACTEKDEKFRIRDI